MQWENCFHELKEIKLRELNYYYEANALEQLKKNFIKRPIHVPKIFRSYCCSKILVMEYIKGALLSDIAYMREKDPARLQSWLQKNNVDLKIVANRLFHSVYRQVFENNFFHGDMHSANIIVLRNNHVAVIECRSAGSHEIESLQKQKLFLRSLAQNEFVNAAEIYFLLATRLPRVDLGVVKEQLIRIWRVWEARAHVRDLDYKEKSLTYMNGEINRILYKSHFKPLWAFSKLTCTWVHLDIAISILSSEFNYIKQLHIYFKDEQKRDTVSKILQLPSRVISSLTALHEIPDRIADYSIFQENLIRRKALVVQSSVSKIDSVIATGFSFTTFCLMITNIFLFLVFLKQQGRVSIESILGSQLTWVSSQIPDLGLGSWIGILTLFTVLYFFFRNQRIRFCKQDFGGDDIGKAETGSPEGRSY
jgi:ubiquinone biosynthesis protein